MLKETNLSGSHRASFGLELVRFSGVLEEISVLLEGTCGEVGRCPVIRGEVSIGFGNALKASLDEITKSSGGTSGASVHVLDTSELNKFLGGAGGDDTSTTRGRDHADTDGTTFTSDLGRDGVGLTELVTPITSADRGDFHFGINDGTTDGGSNFLGAFGTQTDVTVFITDDNESFEASTLTSTGLFLDRGEFQDFVFEFFTEEVVDDLVFLDGNGEHEDFFQFEDLFGFDETAEFGDRDPVLFVTVASFAAFATLALATASATSTVTTTTKTTIKSSTRSFFCHV